MTIIIIRVLVWIALLVAIHILAQHVTAVREMTELLSRRVDYLSQSVDSDVNATRESMRIDNAVLENKVDKLAKLMGYEHVKTARWEKKEK